jgi:hypothetical protein
MATPAFSSSDRYECRPSCSRIFGTPAPRGKPGELVRVPLQSGRCAQFVHGHIPGWLVRLASGELLSGLEFAQGLERGHESVGATTPGVL